MNSVIPNNTVRHSRGAWPGRHEGVPGTRRAAGLKQGVALRRLELDELDLCRQRGDRGLVLELLRRGRLALCEYEVNRGR